MPIARVDDRDEQATSAMVAQRGIKSANDFVDFMGALMADLVEGRIEPDIARAACTAGDKMLKAADMQFKHGIKNADGTKTLALTSGKKGIR